MLTTLGADALRLFLINSPAVKAEDLRFSEKGVTEMSRAILLPFWNAYSFFVTYAKVDGWKPSDAEAAAGRHRTRPLDRVAPERHHRLVSIVRWKNTTFTRSFRCSSILSTT